MPDVTIDVNAFERFDLKSAPPDGYVMLRPLPYGMKLTRRDKASKMMMRQNQGARPNPNTPVEIELLTMQEWAMAYDFGYCIGEHNLTNRDGAQVDFSNAMSLKILNPKVGTEIEQLLAKLNGDEDEESFEDFLKRSSTSSVVEGRRLEEASPSPTDG